MSEAIITRRGFNAGGKPPEPILRTNTFISSTRWTVPNHTGNISVRIFGGGGGGYHLSGKPWSGTGGGGGWMNNADLALANGASIQITIGSGGTVNGAGGTSSFGTYL